MAETKGIILFILWYIGIAYNYLRDNRKRGSHDSYSASSSEISLLAKVGGNQKTNNGNLSHKALVLDEIPVINTSAIVEALETAVDHGESTIGDAVEVVHAVKETVEEFDVEEVNPDEVDDDE
ncbi:hypothetical protein O3G_MSEX002059 [Manduca sexta]|uniref:Uncharacterized protein n=1 Tax=Manduca sexta TaxID=7130 RepID=A0A921YMJ9_MANSE|nr:hypothetical protein O3G_MSEX002059 [Manduca sexta]